MRATFQLAVSIAAVAIVELASAGTAEAYTWHKYASTLGPLWAPTRARPTTAANAITMAPQTNSGGTFIYWLSPTSMTGNHEVYKYDVSMGTSTAFGGPAYMVDLSQDSYYASLFSVDVGNEMYECAGGDSCFTSMRANATSVAARAAVHAGVSSSSHAYLLYTDSTSTCTTAGESQGQCIYCFAVGSWNGGTWFKQTWGAAQVVADQDEANDAAYFLGSSGDIWWASPSGGSGMCSLNTPTNFGNTECGGTTHLVFDQIAAKDGVFAMDSSGTVWYMSPTEACFLQVATQSFNAVSISTDNEGTSGELVWASDDQGAVWYAD